MELDKLWQWERRKLPCVIRPETGNINNHIIIMKTYTLTTR